MIKLLHTADVHLDSPLKSLALRDEALQQKVAEATRNAFRRIVDVALAEEVAALLVAGDLYDGQERSAKTAAFLIGELERLRQAGVAVFMIKGNHDAENPLTGDMALPDNVHVFDGRGGKAELPGTDIYIHGVSFSGRQAPDSLLPKFSGPVAGGINIAMLHTSLAGAPGHDTYAPCTAGDLAALGYDYWALGHVHKRQVHNDAPWIVMPGTPQGRDIGETGPKSASLIEIEGGTITRVREVPTSEVEFRLLELDITAAEDEDALRQLLSQKLREEAAALTAEWGIVRCELTGRPAFGWQILRDRDVWRHTLADMAEATGRLWLEKARFSFEERNEAGTDGEDMRAVAELSGVMDEIRTEEGFLRDAQNEVETLLSLLPADLRKELAPTPEAAQRLTTELAEAGAERLIALMKGAAS